MEALHLGLAACAVAIAACGADPKADTAYPAATHVAIGEVLPDLGWDGIDGRVQLHDFYTPDKKDTLVIRVDGGAWCGTCRWHAAHTKAIASDHVKVLDLVLGDADNAPATSSDLPAWRALVDDPETTFVADPSFSLRDLVPANGAPLPLYVFVDRSTMKVTSWLSNPGPETLASALDGVPRKEERIDGFFRRDQWDLIHDVTMPAAPPADPTNRVADDPAAAALGKSLFSDAKLSPSGTVSCATCHAPDKLLSDDRAVAHGLADGTRRTPRIALAAWSRWQFWDGRADTLWSQALGPFENPLEMGSSRSFVATQIRTRYVDTYRAAFPNESTEDDTRVFVNVGKAIAAYERTFRLTPNALDRYVGGDVDALSKAEKQGLSFFAQVGCFQCHWGPRLTDDAFHVVRASIGSTDRGRIDGLAPGEFHAGSAWSDAPRARTNKTSPSMIGAFKTPSLRGVASATHFGHDGNEQDLVTVTELYGQGGVEDAVGTLEPWLLHFDVTAQWAIAPFLGTLKGDPIVP